MLTYASGNCESCGKSLTGDIEQHCSVTCTKDEKQQKLCMNCRGIITGMGKCRYCGHNELLDVAGWMEHKTGQKIIF